MDGFTLSIDFQIKDGSILVSNCTAEFEAENQATTYHNADVLGYGIESKKLADLLSSLKVAPVCKYYEAAEKQHAQILRQIEAAKLAISQYNGKDKAYSKGLLFELNRLTALKDGKAGSLALLEAAKKDYDKLFL